MVVLLGGVRMFVPVPATVSLPTLAAGGPPGPPAPPTVEWLRGEVTRRFRNQQGRRVTVRSMTYRSNVLDWDDALINVAMLHSPAMEVRGRRQLQQWRRSPGLGIEHGIAAQDPPVIQAAVDLLSLTLGDGLRHLATQAGVAPHPAVLELVERYDGRIDLSGRSLGAADIAPLLQCLAPDSGVEVPRPLERLNLAENALGDGGLQAICACVAGPAPLARLRALDLSGNLAGTAAFKELFRQVKRAQLRGLCVWEVSQAAADAAVPKATGRLAQLEELNLSFNELGDGVLLSLHGFLASTPALRSLVCARRRHYPSPLRLGPRRRWPTATSAATGPTEARGTRWRVRSCRPRSCSRRVWLLRGADLLSRLLNAGAGVVGRQPADGECAAPHVG